MTTQSNGQGLIAQGRIVWTSGDLFKGQHQKDDRTKQLKYNQDGSPAIQYGFGLAIPKVLNGNWHPEYVKVFQALQAEALTLFPGGQIPAGFAMKFKDGDTDVDPTGTPYNKREGYAGHIVLACTTMIPIKYFKHDGQQNVMVNEGIKNGDYVNVQLNIKAHPAIGQGKAGLYVNPSAVQLIAVGKEIINTPSGDQMFGVAAPSYNGEIVAGQAPAMPNMGAPAPMGNFAQPAVSAPMQSMGQPHGTPAPMGGGHAPTAFPSNQPPVAPNYGVLPPQHQPTPANQAPVGNGGMPAFPGR